jgi:uncharacterized protein (DUF697 family)/tellurite resistance protein
MNKEESRAILAISLMAAFADGSRDAGEREEIKRISGSLSDPDINLSMLYQDVLLKRLVLEQAAAAISSSELRQYAYEMAVCVCDADGAHSSQEKVFLDRLRIALKLDGAGAESFAADAAQIASMPLAANASFEPAAPTAGVDEAALDRMVLNYAVLNGALELLPQNLASVAIIPLQMKMVYRIGKAHGFELDRGHIKDLLATLGVGMTSQYIEQLGRKLIGGLLGQIAGGLGRGIGGAATGSAFSFATTYALGQVAKRYYADGRQLSGESLKQAFGAMLEQGKGLQGRYLPDIQQKARTLDLDQVMQAVRQ